jgi:hypothetical protein
MDASSSALGSAETLGSVCGRIVLAGGFSTRTHGKKLVPCPVRRCLPFLFGWLAGCGIFLHAKTQTYCTGSDRPYKS